MKHDDTSAAQAPSPKGAPAVRTDPLAALEQNQPASKKLAAIHKSLRARRAFVHRIAVASYDQKTDIVKTHLFSNDSGQALLQYERKLAEVPTLASIAQSRQPRILTHMNADIPAQASAHRRYLAAQSYASSYTVPLIENNQCLGFVFFDSREPDPFNPAALEDLSTYAHLISLMVLDHLHRLSTLRGAMQTAFDMIHLRDFETGNHLERMSRYSRIIAQELAKTQGLSDEFVEHIFLFAPLHDIGKIAIPDRILLKPGPLDADERHLMNTHVWQGLETARHMIDHMQLENMPYIELLYDLIGGHHESWDGSGYPNGLAQEAIALAARIISVADVFDALCSRRPYKEQWPLERALDWVQSQSGRRFDPECVSALVRRVSDLPAIMQRFDDAAHTHANTPTALP